MKYQRWLLEIVRNTMSQVLTSFMTIWKYTIVQNKVRKKLNPYFKNLN